MKPRATTPSSGLDQPVADQNEGGRPGHVSGHADGAERRACARRHPPDVRVLLELPRQSLVPLIDADADDDEAGDRHEYGTARPAQDAGRSVLGAAARALGARDDLDRGVAERGVRDAAADGRHAALSSAIIVRTRVGDTLDQPPDGVAGEPDGQDDEERLPERLMGDRPHGAGLALRPAAGSDGELEGEDPDDPVDDSTGDEANARCCLQGVSPRGTADGVAARSQRVGPIC
jgi:hypothetical protein